MCALLLAFLSGLIIGAVIDHGLFKTRVIFVAMLALLGVKAYAQDPPPCSPESPMHTDYYPPEDGNCQPCFAGYYVTTDTNYGIACDAGCDPVRYDVCAPDRQVIQTQLFGCHYDGQACPTVQFPYLCQLETIVYDYCTNQTCGPYTLGPPFCNDRLSFLKEKNRAKTLLARIRALRSGNCG